MPDLQFAGRLLHRTGPRDFILDNMPIINQVVSNSATISARVGGQSQYSAKAALSTDCNDKASPRSTSTWQCVSVRASEIVPLHDRNEAYLT
jgi:hypothetical protein